MDRNLDYHKAMVCRYRIDIKLSCNGPTTTITIKLLLILGAEHFMHVVFFTYKEQDILHIHGSKDRFKSCPKGELCIIPQTPLLDGVIPQA